MAARAPSPLGFGDGRLNREAMQSMDLADRERLLMELIGRAEARRKLCTQWVEQVPLGPPRQRLWNQARPAPGRSRACIHSPRNWHATLGLSGQLGRIARGEQTCCVRRRDELHATRAVHRATHTCRVHLCLCVTHGAAHIRDCASGAERMVAGARSKCGHSIKAD